MSKIKQQIRWLMARLGSRPTYTTGLLSMIFLAIMVLSFTGTPSNQMAGAASGSLFPHLKTWITVLERNATNAEQTWLASKFDIVGGAIGQRDNIKAINPSVVLCDYLSAPNWNDSNFSYMQQWATDNGYDFEDFFLHHREDTTDTFWNRSAKGWRDECSPSSCTPPATATSEDESRVWATWKPRPNWREKDVTAPQTLLHDVAAKNRYGLLVADSPTQCLYIDSVPVFDFVLGLLGYDKTHKYYGLPIDYDHPRITEQFQYGANVVNEINNQYGLNVFGIANATATSVSLRPEFKGLFEQYYDWTWIEVWRTFLNSDNNIAGVGNMTTYERDYDGAINQITLQTLGGEKKLLRINEYSGRQSDRGKIFLLAEYYLVNNDNTYLNYRVVAPPGDTLYDDELSTWSWFDAIEYNIGQPATNPIGQTDFNGNLNTAEHYEWATGQDPADATKTYHVIARHYDNALILVKYRPDGSTIGAASETTHQLDQPYFPLRADGTLGPAVSEISLSNNEAAILIPDDIIAPNSIIDLRTR